MRDKRHTVCLESSALQSARHTASIHPQIYRSDAANICILFVLLNPTDFFD